MLYYCDNYIFFLTRFLPNICIVLKINILTINLIDGEVDDEAYIYIYEGRKRTAERQK